MCEPQMIIWGNEVAVYAITYNFRQTAGLAGNDWRRTSKCFQRDETKGLITAWYCHRARILVEANKRRGRLPA